MYYTYMIRCKDNSIYTGMTNDIEKRMDEHFNRKKEGAKYTKSHQAEKIEIVWKTKEKTLACKLEYRIKTLPKSKKETLIKNKKIKDFFCGLDCRKFRIMDLKELDKRL